VTVPNGGAAPADRPVLDDVLELAREAAMMVHGAEPIERKLDWACRTATQRLHALWCVCVLSESGRGKVRATSGIAPVDVEPVADVVISRLLRLALAGTRTLQLADARQLGVSGPGAQAAVIVVPVVSATGAVHGGLLVAHEYPPDDDATHQLDAMAALLGTHLGVALDNLATITRLAQLEASQREVVHQLQEAVRPPMPPASNAELGVHYLAADPHEPTGGDLYDWQVLPDGDLHLVVVDVLGKGVAATKDALAVTYTLRLLVLDGCSIDKLVQRADELLASQNPDLVATLMIARYRPSTGEVWLVGGGHPPALVIRHGGAVEEVAAPGIPIGWPGAGSNNVVSLRLERSDTLLLYTDGLIESTKNVVDGLRQLTTAAQETASYPAEQLARTLVDRTLADAQRRDDTLALVLRRRTAPVASGAHLLGPFEYRFTANLAAVPLARHLLADWLAGQPLDPDATSDLLLAASELCANAVRFASGRQGSVSMRARTEGDAVVLEVEDDGGRPISVLDGDDADVATPDPEAEAGRGLYLVQALTDDITTETDGALTIVRCVKRAVVPV